MSGWSHYPNAEHIDRVLKVFETHYMYCEHKDEDRAARVWEQACDKIAGSEILDHIHVIYSVHICTLRKGTTQTRLSAAHDVCLCLLMYDDCAYMLDSDPDDLELLSALGDHRATMLLPACRMFRSVSDNVITE